MSTRTFDHWLKLYGDAWSAGDSDGVLHLFSADAVYFETPFDPPLVGHDAIRRYWTEGAENAQRNVKFEAHPISFDGKMGFALWHATFERVSSDARVELDGVLSVHFDAQMLCVVFREWWHRRETAVSTIGSSA